MTVRSREIDADNVHAAVARLVNRQLQNAVGGYSRDDPCAMTDEPVTIQAARAKARSVIGNLALRRNGEYIAVLPSLFAGFDSETSGSGRKPHRALPPPDNIEYDRHIAIGPELYLRFLILKGHA
jgi:hypothetical protein